MDRLEIIKKLGEGGNSRAFLARDNSTGRLVTYKRAKINSGENVDAFGHEASVLKCFGTKKYMNLIRKKRIPKLVCFGRTFIVVSFIPGENLLDLLRKRGKLREKEVLKIAGDLLTILRILHEGENPVVYRDLKPANIVINEEGRASLIDFGAARFYRKDKQADDTVSLGTVGFAAPEQYGCLGQSNEQTDIYSFGMTLTALLTGVNTKDSEGLSMVRCGGLKDVSPQLLSVIEKCIKADREKRFKTFEDVEKEIKKVPLRIFLCRLGRVAKLAAAALFISAIITMGIKYGDSAVKLIKNDFEDRYPVIQYRLLIARQRITDFAGTFIIQEN